MADEAFGIGRVGGVQDVGAAGAHRASELEMQKVLYFAKQLGQPLTLPFTRGRYGPYGHGLNRVFAELEGHYTTGFGDDFVKVTEYAPINLTPGSYDEGAAVLDEESVGRIDTVLNLAEGFETPYGMELLATAHFAAHDGEPTADPTAVSERVAAWNIRKARLFTDAHVKVATARLQEHSLLPA